MFDHYLHLNPYIHCQPLLYEGQGSFRAVGCNSRPKHHTYRHPGRFWWPKTAPMTRFTCQNPSKVTTCQNLVVFGLILGSRPKSQMAKMETSLPRRCWFPSKLYRSYVAVFAGKRLRSADDIAWCMTRAPSCHLRTFFVVFDENSGPLPIWASFDWNFEQPSCEQYKANFCWLNHVLWPGFASSALYLTHWAVVLLFQLFLKP